MELTLYTHLPAWIPSHVDDSLMSTRSLLMPASSYRAMSLRALATISSLSNDSLLGEITESLSQNALVNLKTIL